MRKKTLFRIFAIILCLVLLVTALVACKPKPEPPIDQDKIEEEARAAARAELGEALANSIDLTLQNGFNLDLSGSVGYASNAEDETAWNYGFKIKGNVLAPSKGDTKGNNDFTIEITKGNEVIFGIYNNGTDMYLSLNTGEEELTYSFYNAPLFESLRYVLATNIPTYNTLPSLGNIEVLNGSLKDLITNYLPIIITALDTEESIVKEGNTISVDLNIGALGGLIASLVPDLGIDITAILPETVMVSLSVEIANKNIKNIDASIKLYDDNIDADASFVLESGNDGLFGAVKDDYKIDAAVVKKFENVEQTSLLQIETNGTLNLMNNGTIVKSFDWSLKAKLDVAIIMQKNLMLDDPYFAKNNNFFHFQLTHTCGKHSDCTNYCDNTVVNAVVTDDMNDTDNAFAGKKLRTSYRNGSIIDLLWGPKTMGSSNITLDLSLFDLISAKELGDIVGDIIGGALGHGPTLAKMLSMVLSGHFATSIDTNALLLAQDIKGINSVKEPIVQVADGGFDIGGIIGIITDLMGAVSMDNGVNLDIDIISDLIGNLLGVGELLPGVGISNILDLVFGNEVNQINLAGADGPGSYVNFEFSKKSLDTYDTYAMYSKNLNGLPGTRFDKDATGATAYGGVWDFLENITGNLKPPPFEAMPILYMKDAEVESNGNFVLYTLGPNPKLMGKPLYTKVDGEITAYQFENEYAMGKKLYIKYNYIGLDKNEYSHYIGLNCVNGLDLTKAGAQDVKIGTGLLMAQGFDYLLNENLLFLVAGIVSGLNFIELAPLLPINTQVVEGKLNIVPSKAITDITVTPECGVAIKATDDIKNLNATATYKIDGVAYTRAVSGDISDLPRDINGQIVAGEYNVKYTLPGGVVQTLKITVTGAASIEYVPGALELTVEFGSKVTDINLGTVKYTYPDETVVSLNVKDLIAKGYATYKATKGVEDGKFNKAGEIELIVSVNGDSTTYAVTVKDKIQANKYTITMVFEGIYHSVVTVVVEPGANIRYSAVLPSNPEFNLKPETQTADFWYTDAACTKKLITGTYVKADITLYAKSIEWRELTWRANFAGTTYTYKQKVELNKSVTSLPDSSKIPYTAVGNQWISGWSIGGYVEDVTKLPITEDTIYYAVMKTTTVTFKTGYGNKISTPIQLNFGTGTKDAKLLGKFEYRLSIPKDNFAQYMNVPPYYTFVDWYTDPGLKTNYDGNITGDMTLYAKYNSNYTFNYKYMGEYEAKDNITLGNIEFKLNDIEFDKTSLKVDEDKNLFYIEYEDGYGFRQKVYIILEVNDYYVGSAIAANGDITFGEKYGKGIQFTASVIDNGVKLSSSVITVLPKQASTTYEYTWTDEQCNITLGTLKTFTYKNITVKDGKIILEQGTNKYYIEYGEGEKLYIDLSVDDTYYKGSSLNEDGGIILGKNSRNVLGIELNLSFLEFGSKSEYETSITITAPIAAKYTYTGDKNDANITQGTIASLTYKNISITDGKILIEEDTNKFYVEYGEGKKLYLNFTVVANSAYSGNAIAENGGITWGSTTAKKDGITFNITIEDIGYSATTTSISVLAPTA